MRLPTLVRGAPGVATGLNFTDKLQAARRQLSVNRKSTPLLAMKYAIGEITFLGVRFGMSLRPGMFKPCTTAESPSKVSHEVRDWQKLFYVLRTGALGSWAVRERL